MAEQYEGMAVGGPKAGQWFVAQSRQYIVEVATTMYPRMPAADEGPMIRDRETVCYQWVVYCGVGLWVVERMSIDDMFRELASNYRPAAFRNQG